jgi:protein TonB
MASKKINIPQQFGKPRQWIYMECDSAGVKLQDGNYTGSRRSGKWTTYYPSGKVRSVTNYSEGRVNGLFTKWYQNGKKMIEMHVFENGLNTPPDVWDEKGKVIKMGTKTYNEIVEGNKPGEMFNDPSMYQRPIIDRRVEDAMPDEVEEIFDTEVGGADEPFNAIEDPNKIYDYPEIAAAFPGGDTALMNFIARNIQYPPIAREMEKQGTVYVKFVVETNGIVSNVQVVRDVQGAPEFSAEAIRIVHLFPPHISARNNGRAVRSSMIVPIKFSLL